MLRHCDVIATGRPLSISRRRVRLGRLVVGGALAAVALSGCLREPHTTPTVYEIPASYSGWVVVEYGQRDAPALPVEAGKRVLRISATGFLATSSPQESGIVHQEFYRIDAGGHRTQLEDVSLRQDVGPKAAEMSFPDVVVCCFQTGDRTEQGRRRTFDGFYVGHGPSGYEVPWPRP
jgi:hypothetical protein